MIYLLTSRKFSRFRLSRVIKIGNNQGCLSDPIKDNGWYSLAIYRLCILYVQYTPFLHHHMVKYRFFTLFKLFKVRNQDDHAVSYYQCTICPCFFVLSLSLFMRGNWHYVYVVFGTGSGPAGVFETPDTGARPRLFWELIGVIRGRKPR